MIVPAVNSTDVIATLYYFEGSFCKGIYNSLSLDFIIYIYPTGGAFRQKLIMGAWKFEQDARLSDTKNILLTL